MQIRDLHRWDVTPAEARALQSALREHAERSDRLGQVTVVAGVDIGFERGGRTTRAAAVALDAATLEPLDRALVTEATRFPYVPGLLSFREVPAAARALAALDPTPDLVLCDGHGYAHPRRFGLASHLGLVLDCPTIGVGKSRLVGTHGEVPPARGAWTALEDAGEVIGAVLRTRARVSPVFVSTGHRVCLATSIEWVMRCVTRYRLPETTRAADRLASRR